MTFRGILASGPSCWGQISGATYATSPIQTRAASHFLQDRAALELHQQIAKQRLPTLLRKLPHHVDAASLLTLDLVGAALRHEESSPLVSGSCHTYR